MKLTLVEDFEELTEYAFYVYYFYDTVIILYLILCIHSTIFSQLTSSVWFVKVYFTCQIYDGPSEIFCLLFLQYVQKNWELPCFAMENNIRKDDICSILIYLSEVLLCIYNILGKLLISYMPGTKLFLRLDTVFKNVKCPTV